MDEFYDFTNCRPSLKQFGGSDQKNSIYFNEERYMLKFPDKIDEKKRNDLNSSSRNNIFSEYVACHIIDVFGYPVQKTLLGKGKTRDDVIKNAVACKDFCVDGYSLNEFEEYKSSYPVDFKNVKYPEIKDVLDATVKYEKEIAQDAIERFWDTFAIDALLGNFDRHTGNWGFLYNDEKEDIKLAPIYDCGSSLYPMISDVGMQVVLFDPKEVQTRIYSYPKAAFMYNKEQVYYDKFLVEKTDDKNVNSEIDRAVKKLSDRYDNPTIEKIIDDTPIISDVRRNFYKFMIKKRMDCILKPAMGYQITVNKESFKQTESKSKHHAQTNR